MFKIKKTSWLPTLIHARTKRSDTEPVLKKAKIQNMTSKVKDQLDTFVKSFISAFIKHLAVYYITAKGERLTAEALKAELKMGIISSLIDLSLAQIGLGSLPSIASSIRTLSSQYYLSREKAQRITKAFETVSPGALSQLLGVAAVEIFQSFEMQFMHVTDKAGDKMAMEKLAEDAAGRALNYIAEHSDNNPISNELITKAIIFGHSEKFFDPSIGKVRIRISGNTIQDKDGNLINTANLYEKIGLIVSNADSRLNKLYRANNNLDGARYGYRRLLSWEKGENNELNAYFERLYRQETLPQKETLFQYNLRRYEYCLQFSSGKQEAARILSAYKKLDLAPQEINISLQTTIKKTPILFDLRKPVKNFTGRTAILNDLHDVLISGRATVIVSLKLSALSINSPVVSSAQSSNMQTAICGLGGIGKTQLALRYAELYAEAYDQNVLWINAETKVTLANSLKKLANKLIIETKDKYGEEKDLEEIIEEIYTYFSTGKSLFIFDNVENYRDIEPFLPKVQTGNKPKILLTSRYRNWKNIATIVSLDVFSEEETTEFIRQELNIRDNTQNIKIKELNNLLQGLPLVLQQATAYINNQRNINNQFSISDYIKLYQEKSQALLDFDFSNYSNDPYTKTVLITWQITLDKIQQDPKDGALAIEILHIMAYICPDNIANSLFLPMKNSEALANAIHLLKSYSMINQGNQQDTSTIHRLVQQVTRIQLEMNPNEFKKIAEETIHLIGDYSRNKVITYHFIYFLLHMNQHLELAEKLNFRATQKRILEILTYAETDKDSLIYWFDTAQLLYPRKTYLNFMGEALFIYMHYAMLPLLCDTMDYIENKLTEGLFSKTEVLSMLKVKYQVSSKHYKSRRLAPEYEERKRQFDAIRLIYEFEHKLFPLEAPTACSSKSRKKRNIDSRCSSLEEEASKEKPIVYQNIKQHLQKVSHIARLVSTSLFTKDTLSAMLRGDFSTVAVNFGLLSSSKILGEIANKLLTHGEALSSADEVLLLEKNLDLNSKLALSILTDEAVLNSEKKIFFGNTMKIASPFIARGTSVFFAHTLIQQIKAYKSGNKEELHSIISNGIIVGMDGLESGIEAAEYLEAIEGISATTGPLGESVAAIIWLESDLYHVKQQVTAIEQYVHLDIKEEAVEKIRASLHMDPSAYLEIRARNNQRVKNVIPFFKNHTSIQRYIFSAEFSNSQVFLNKKTNIILNKNMPDTPSEGSLFCLDGNKNLITKSSQWVYVEPYPPFIDWIFGSEVSIYLCKNAIGVEYAQNRTGNVTLIALDKGNSTVIGGGDFPILFLVNQGEKNYSCNDIDCLFILQGEAITGILSGGKGVNLVNLEGFYPKADNYALIDEQGYVCGKNSNDEVTNQFCNNGLELKNIQQIRGRIDKKDVIYITKAIEDVDAYGGKNQNYPDHIYITKKSSKNLKIVLRANTMVHLEPNISIDTVDYRIPQDQAGKSNVQLLFNSPTQHRFYFDFSIQDLTTIILQDNKLMFNFFYQQSTYNLTITDFKDSGHYASYPEFPIQAYYLFQDTTEIKLLNKKNIHARLHSNKTIDEIVNKYPSMASRLNMMLSIQLSQNETVLIGYGKHVILSNDVFAVKSHLIGNGVENVYVISSMINNTDPSSDPFPIPEVILYNLKQEYLENTDTLDLRYIEQQAKKQCSEQKITPRIFEEGMDLVLSLNADYYPLPINNCIQLSMGTWSIASFRVKNALVDNWYQQLDIILHNVPMNIIASNQGWRLEQLPLIFNRHKEIIVITETDIEPEPEIMIVKKAGQYTFFRNESDLFITNILDSNTAQDNFWTIMLHQAYEPSKIKLLSTTLTFIDQEIVLKEHKKQIKNASSFHDLFKEYTDETNNLTLNNTHDSVSQGSQQQHLPTNKKSARRKRQADHSGLIANSENMRINAITEQYLEKYDYHNLKTKAYHSKKSSKKYPHILNYKLKTKQPESIKQNTNVLNPIKSIQETKQKFQIYPNFKKIKEGSKYVLPRHSKNTNKTIEKVSYFHTKRFSTPNQQHQSLANSFHSINYLPNNKKSDRKIPISTTSFMTPRLSYQQDTHHRQTTLSRITATPDMQGLILLADVFTRKITKEKYRQPFFAKPVTKPLAERVEKIKARA